MRQTAWTKQNSSLPSDRIPPKAHSPAPQPATKGKGKQKDPAGPPKSKEVLALQKLRDDLSRVSGSEKDKNGGCFCLAKMHPLSSYNPICTQCGFILCELNPPNFACPSCGDALFTPSARAALVADLDARIAETLAKEEQERQRIVEAARAAEGAFPTLAISRASTPGSGAETPSSAAQAQSHPANQTYKVLSLDSSKKGKGRVKLASYTPPTVSRAPSKERKPPPAPDFKRVPTPPAEVPCQPADPQRPWKNVRGLGVTYVPPARA